MRMSYRTVTYPYEFKRSEFPDGSTGIITVISPTELHVDIFHPKDPSITSNFKFLCDTTRLTPDVVYQIVQESAHRWIIGNKQIKDQALANGATLQ